MSATAPNPIGTATMSMRSVAARVRCSSLHDSGKGRTVDMARPARSIPSCATTVSM